MVTRLKLFGLALASALVVSAAAPSAIAQPKTEAKTGDVVSATPISIPSPTRLKTYDPSAAAADAPVPIPKPQPGVVANVPSPRPSTGGYGIGAKSGGQAVGEAAMLNDVIAADILYRKDAELHGRLRYAIDPGRPRPAYVGAWLFGPDGRDVGVGYRPTALPAANRGDVDIVLTLPDRQFETAYLEAFLLHSGKTIAKRRFAAAYVWNAAAASAGDLTAVDQIQGAWTADVFGQAVEYVFTADGDAMNDPRRFQWRADAFQQVAKGRILPGNRLQARWREPSGAAASTADVELDKTGAAVRMVWANGVVMTRNPN